MQRAPDASAVNLHAFIHAHIQPGSIVYTDAWQGYQGLEGYTHKVTALRGQRELASRLLPRVHRVISLLKRWVLGTHQGAVNPRTWITTWTSSRFASIAGHRTIAASFSIGCSSKPWPPIPPHISNSISTSATVPSTSNTTCSGYLSQLNTPLSGNVRKCPGRGGGVLRLCRTKWRYFVKNEYNIAHFTHIKGKKCPKMSGL